MERERNGINCTDWTDYTDERERNGVNGTDGTDYTDGKGKKRAKLYGLDGLYG